MACGIRAWHWLSLDAVTALICYQWAVQKAAGVSLPWWVPLMLGGGIWCGYAADRLLDVARDPERAATSARHAFHQRHERSLSLIWIGAAGSLFVVGWLHLPPAAFFGGGIVALAAAVYVWCSTRRSDRKRVPYWRWKKRIGTVAVLSIAGGWWMIWRPPTNPLAAAAMVAIFALAAWWSLSLMHHHLVAPLGWYRYSMIGCALTIPILAACTFDKAAVSLPVTLMVGLMLLASPALDFWERSKGSTTLRSRDSLVPPLIDGGLSLVFLLFALTL